MTTTHPMRSRRGFTLIELAATLAVVAVLASLAWAGYGHHVQKARRAEGRAALLQVLLQQERQFSLRHSYRAFSPGAGETEFKWFSGERPERSAYRLAALACPGEALDACVRVTATPSGSHSDAQCGALFADTLGRRGAATDADGCW